MLKIRDRYLPIKADGEQICSIYPWEQAYFMQPGWAFYLQRKLNSKLLLNILLIQKLNYGCRADNFFFKKDYISVVIINI